MVVRLCMIWWEPIFNFPSGNPSRSLCSSHKIFFKFPEYTSSLMFQGHQACCLISLECCFYHSSLVSLLLILQIVCHFFNEAFLETLPFHCLNYLSSIILSHSTLSQYFFFFLSQLLFIWEFVFVCLFLWTINVMWLRTESVHLLLYTQLSVWWPINIY